MPLNPNILAVIDRLRKEREKKGISEPELDELLKIGPGWIASMENGEIEPKLDIILSITELLDIDFDKLLKGVNLTKGQGISRPLFAIERKTGLELHFNYNDYDAKYFLSDAKLDDFNEVLTLFRTELANGKKSMAIRNLFQNAMKKWPYVNPSDIWYFFVLRAYLDPFNHPSTERRRDLAQSWKRASGWALESVIVDFYSRELQKHGIQIAIVNGPEKIAYLKKMKLNFHVEAGKADVLLINRANGANDCFGVIHVKASIAERRQNDQAFSKALLDKKFFSAFVTMDCKATPSSNPMNKGELGIGFDKNLDERSDKRREFEEEGYFSGCFSFNKNTIPTLPGQKATARVHQIDMLQPNDSLVRMIVDARDALYS